MAFEETTVDALGRIGEEIAVSVAQLTAIGRPDDPVLQAYGDAVLHLSLAMAKTVHVLASHFADEAMLRNGDD